MRIHSFALLLLSTVAVDPLARASEPDAVYSVPSKVEYFPDRANATSVVLHGAFFFLKAPNTYAYNDPKCGYMYFECLKGQESACRMEWQDIESSIGDAQICRGFGTSLMVTTATLRSEGTPLANPDAFDLGAGVAWGAWVDGKCPAAHQLACAGAAPVDGGVNAPPDLALPNDRPDLATAPQAPDLATPKKDPAAPDGKTPMLANGCTVSGRAPSQVAVAVWLGLLALGIETARRRRCR